MGFVGRQKTCLFLSPSSYRAWDVVSVNLEAKFGKVTSQPRLELGRIDSPPSLQCDDNRC